MTLFVINANQMFLILLLVSCISLIKTEAIAKESKSHIVSKITIITSSNIKTKMSSNITLYNVEEFQSYLTKISITSTNICLLTYTNLNAHTLVEYCLKPKESEKNTSTIYMTNDESILSDLYYYSAKNISDKNSIHKTNFSAVLYPNAIDPSIISHTLAHPLFIINLDIYQLFQKLLLLPPESKQNEIDSDNITISIIFDNTSLLLPYDYLYFSKFSSLITSILLIVIILISRRKKFYKVIISLSLMKFIYSFLFIYLTNFKLTYINEDYHNVYVSIENAFEIICGIINIMYLTVLYTTILMVCHGWGIMYSSLNRNRMKRYYIIFITLYVLISLDCLFDIIHYNFFGFLSITTGKNLVMIFIISLLCFRYLNYNIKTVNYKIIYALSYARNYYTMLNSKLLTLKRLRSTLERYLICSIIILFLFCDYNGSYYYKFIKKVNRENIECMFSLLFALIIGTDKERGMDLYDLMSGKNQIKKFGIYKWNGKIDSQVKNEHNTKDAHQDKIPIIVSNPFFDENNGNKKDFIKQIKIGFVVNNDE